MLKRESDARRSVASGGSSSPGETCPEQVPQVIASTPIYEGRILKVRVDSLSLSGGDTVTREVVEHPGAVVVAAVDEEGQIYLVRQYRHAVGHWLLELPAGCLEPGEDPVAAARRELREEVGLEAAQWSELGAFYSSPGFTSEILHAFLARGLKTVAPDPDDDEDITVVRHPLQGIEDVKDCLLDGKTLATLYLLRQKERDLRRFLGDDK